MATITRDDARYTTSKQMFIRMTPEFGPASTGPADYFIRSWSNHREARRVIDEAMMGRPGSFETPMGLMMVRAVDNED